jgi:hypothetical protein
MCSFTTVALIFCILVVDRSRAEMTRSQVSAMSTKQLKQELATKGLECIGCAEKGDFVQKVKLNRHLFYYFSIADL